MQITVTLDTEQLTNDQFGALVLLMGANGEQNNKPATAAPAKPAKAAAKPAKDFNPDADAQADAEGDGPDIADAVAAATKLVSTGESAKVKEALESVGAKRVSELGKKDIPAFLAALA